MSRRLPLLLLPLFLPSLLPAQDADRALAARRVGELVSWHVAEPFVLPEGRNREEVRESAAAHAGFDRDTAFAAALAHARTTGRPLLWYAPRVLAADPGFREGRQMYRPAVLDGYARAVFFSDPEIATLLAERFVPVRLAVTPALGERFDLRAPTTVEPALFVISPGGVITRRIDRLRSFNAGWLWRVLAACVVPEDEVAGPSTLDPAEALARGFDPSERLAASLADARTEAPRRRELLLLAVRAHRLHGRPAEALATARLGRDDAAFPTASEEDFADALRLERGRAELALGKLEAALATLRRIDDPSLRAPARYAMGLSTWYRGSNTFARRHFEEAFRADPEGPIGARAAANLVDGRDLTPLGPALHGYEDPFHRDLPLDATTTGRAARAPTATAREALDFLLRMQRDDGGWTDSRYAYWPSPDLTPNVWAATTALALSALQEWRHLDPARVQPAIERGERWLLEQGDVARGFQEEVYAEAYELAYLLRKHARSDVPTSARQRPAELRRAGEAQRMRRIVDRLVDLQEGSERASGFFGHEYPNPFTTAVVLNALNAAREQGLMVPTVVMERGADALLSVRDADGAFGYAAGRMPRGDLETRLKNSMGRSAICEAAILAAGHEAGSQERLSAALEIFWRFRDRLARIRLCDFHTDGELGGFFFWHAVLHTAETFERLPEEEGRIHSRRMRDFLLELAEQDGSFLDSHEMGKSYGTAMALLALDACMEDDF